MRLGSGLASTEFAFLSRLGSAGGTTHDPRLILPSSHDLIMHDSSPMGWSILIVFGLCAARMYSNRGVALLRHCSEGRVGSVPFPTPGQALHKSGVPVSSIADGTALGEPRSSPCRDLPGRPQMGRR